MLRELDSMDRCARLTLSDYLARRTLEVYVLLVGLRVLSRAIVVA